MSLQTLTVVSTICIVGSGASLLVGWYLIRWRRDQIAHRNAMLTATVLAALFLVFYVTRWTLFGTKLFAGTGGWRILYFTILVPHVLLAIAVGPLAVRLIQLALWRRDFAAHRRLAKVTLPAWLFVAASGWMIYYLLYVKTY
jgi:putative membrane protein